MEMQIKIKNENIVTIRYQNSTIRAIILKTIKIFFTFATI